MSVFPDNINLACDVGECANEQDFLDVQPPVSTEWLFTIILIISCQEKVFSRFTESIILFAIFMACLIIYFVTRLTAKRQQQMFGTRIQLNDDDEPQTASNIVELLRKEVYLTFDDVCYTVSGKHVLKNLCGYVEPGQLLAIMGPSGAGKSSLLDILARKHKRGVTSGRIMVNGVVPNRRDFKQITGYVDQEDSLMGTLTVRETLMYAAMLRLPRHMPARFKHQRVQEVISELGLEAIADAVVGSPGQRGISGGEKRRVSIGKELVTSPSLLFLDEPTSGLDAYNAGVVMDCLRRLTKQGRRTVVVTIHQVNCRIRQEIRFFVIHIYPATFKYFQNV